MNSEEVRVTYKELAGIMRDAGLGWVLAQVEGVIGIGKPTEKSINIFADEEPETGLFGSLDERFAPRRRGKATQMMSVEPWSEAEQLRFLIDAVRHAVVYASEVEDEVIRLLTSFERIEPRWTSENRP